MLPYLTFVSLLLLTKSASALSSCIAFDSNWNLLAFGFNGKDYNAGPRDSWASGSPTDITASGRPPFNGANTTCYLTQFDNAIYVLGADSANPASIYIYDATAKSWTTQSVTVADKFDPKNFVAILDHDTDVFYAMSNGEWFALEMEDRKAAKPDPVPWKDIQAPPFDVTGYQPVFALAENHVHFLNVPNVPAGSAEIFVIHFSYFQPEIQHYGDFPAQHGQTASIFLDQGVQTEFVYVPDDGSKTYVINVVSNTTQSFAGPPTKDAGAMYFASPDSIVQLASSGAVSYFPYNAQNAGANAAASWSTVQSLASLAQSGGSSSSGSGSSSTTGASGQTTGKGSPTNTAKSGGSTNTNSNGTNTGGNSPGAASPSRSVAFGLGSAMLFGSIALLL